MKRPDTINHLLGLIAEGKTLGSGELMILSLHIVALEHYLELYENLSPKVVPQNERK